MTFTWYFLGVPVGTDKVSVFQDNSGVRQVVLYGIHGVLVEFDPHQSWNLASTDHGKARIGHGVIPQAPEKRDTPLVLWHFNKAFSNSESVNYLYPEGLKQSSFISSKMNSETS